MEFLQNIDLVTVAIVGCGLCIVGVILLFALQLVGGALGAVGNIVELVTGILSAGPLEFCGCIILFGGCGFCGLIILLVVQALGACDTNPTNFCALLGR